MISLHKLRSLIPLQLLDKLAVEYDVNADNHVRLPGQSVFLCLLNGLLNHPMLTLRMLEDQYRVMTGKSCDHSSFGKRIANISPHYFRAIFDDLRARLTPAKGDPAALKIRRVDATVVTISAKLLNFGLRANHGNKGDKRQVKSVVELSEEGLPNLLRVCKEQCEFSDMAAIGRTMKSATAPNDLWVFDKGCHGRELLLCLHEAGAFWLTPHSNQTLMVQESILESDCAMPERAPGDAEQPYRIARVEQAVFDNKGWHHVKGLSEMRLIVIHCYRWDTRSKTWKPFVLMTNLPLSECKAKAGPYSFEEVVEIYRQRWEIEVFFKLLKQHLSYKHLTSRTENGIEVIILMSMIASLLLIWYRQQTGIDRGWRSVKLCLAEDVRSWTAYSLRKMQLYART